MERISPATWCVIVGAVISLGLGVAEVILDMSGSHADLVIQDGFRASIVATLTALAAARAAADHKNGGTS